MRMRRAQSRDMRQEWSSTNKEDIAKLDIETEKARRTWFPNFILKNTRIFYMNAQNIRTIAKKTIKRTEEDKNTLLERWNLIILLCAQYSLHRRKTCLQWKQSSRYIFICSSLIRLLFITDMFLQKHHQTITDYLVLSSFCLSRHSISKFWQRTIIRISSA